MLCINFANLDESMKGRFFNILMFFCKILRAHFFATMLLLTTISITTKFYAVNFKLYYIRKQIKGKVY